MSLRRFDSLVDELRCCLGDLPDKRTGKNTRYAMETIGLSAFSVFFTQSPSWLAHQRAMEQNKGKSNAQTLFHVEQIPTDNHVRDMLDPVRPEAVYPVYDRVYKAFTEQGILDTFRSIHNTRLIALDGTWYFSSQSGNVNCQNCLKIEHTNGQTTHYHSAITPVIVGPGKPYAIALRPEFIVPQDGDTKQDCEIKAGKRWLDKSWKIENENNNVLKNRGYHLKHNFGHGKQHLSSLLAALNILAFLFHSFLTFCDDAYRLVRAKLHTRQTFFDHIRCLTCYHCFESWAAMMDFMMRGLEIGPYAPPEA